MNERRQDLGWLGVFTGMTGLILLALLILIALGERVTGEDALPTVDVQSPPPTTAATRPSAPDAPLDSEAENIAAAPQSLDLAAYLQDGETVQLHFLSELSVAGRVQLADGVLTLLDPLGDAVNLAEVALIVKQDGQTLAPADFGIQPAPAVEAGAVETIAVEDVDGSVAAAPVAVQVEPGPDAQAEVNGPGDLAVSAILDQYPEGTLFTARLQNGEQVVAVKENRLKLVRVDLLTGAPSNSIVPPWMIESLTPVS